MADVAQSVDTRPTADLLSPAFYDGDPHSAYSWMRANEPVYRDEANELWAVTRHADLHDVERRADDFVSGLGYRSFHSPEETNMIAQDDPRHSDQRSLISRRFTPKAVHGHEEWLRATTRSMIDQFVDLGSVEVVDGLAAQLPCRLTARLLGWDESRWPDIKSWSERLMRYDRIYEDLDSMVAMGEAILEFNNDLQPMIEERRGCPAEDLVGVWANAEIDGAPFDEASIMHETGLVISGGAETTRTVITRGLRTFCDHNDQWERLRAEPELIPSAVDEWVRWVTPLHNFFRTATRDTVVGDQQVKAGDRIVLLYASANRDEEVFDEPFRFDVTRSPNPHLGFGFGTHFCLGASLARFELTIVLEELVASIANLHVATEVQSSPNMFAWCADSFTLGFDRRA
jgi:cytochrome P450 family 142 subfamily A polypeptide 1